MHGRQAAPKSMPVPPPIPFIFISLFLLIPYTSSPYPHLPLLLTPLLLLLLWLLLPIPSRTYCVSPTSLAPPSEFSSCLIILYTLLFLPRCLLLLSHSPYFLFPLLTPSLILHILASSSPYIMLILLFLFLLLFILLCFSSPSSQPLFSSPFPPLISSLPQHLGLLLLHHNGHLLFFFILLLLFHFHVVL